MPELIDTDKFSEAMRRKGVDLDRQRILISKLAGSEQEKDITKQPNCGGYGRIRHFRRRTTAGWPANPLPNDPAHKALGLPTTDVMHAQVFQNAVCNWRCWYCFVPFALLAGDEQNAGWLSAKELLDLYLAEPDSERAAMIDLTGGQPDLVPEWVPWMMSELRRRGLEGKVYLWSDDNLSNDYFWQHLTDADRELVATFRGYGRVACFKGFDADSFSYNTKAAPELFDRQFDLFARLLALGIDLYAYTTFTATRSDNIGDSMARFVDRLQSLEPNLPLRTVPLEVYVAGVVKERAEKQSFLPQANESLLHQRLAIDAWCRELEHRFSSDERAQSIADVPLAAASRR
ncbi:MAG: hypothetical protein IPI49_01285 [Myxococcales bacterium]|nr:hypothetical protein [Myxococcales bacterium]